MKLHRVAPAEYRRSPGGVFERLAQERPTPAIYYYEYRRRGPSIGPSQLADLLKRAYPAEKIEALVYRRG